MRDINRLKPYLNRQFPTRPGASNFYRFLLYLFIFHILKLNLYKVIKNIFSYTFPHVPHKSLFLKRFKFFRFWNVKNAMTRLAEYRTVSQYYYQNYTFANEKIWVVLGIWGIAFRLISIRSSIQIKCASLASSGNQSDSHHEQAKTEPDTWFEFQGRVWLNWRPLVKDRARCTWYWADNWRKRKRSGRERSVNLLS